MSVDAFEEGVSAGVSCSNGVINTGISAAVAIIFIEAYRHLPLSLSIIEHRQPRLGWYLWIHYVANLAASQLGHGHHPVSLLGLLMR